MVAHWKGNDQCGDICCDLGVAIDYVEITCEGDSSAPYYVSLSSQGKGSVV